MVKKEQDRSFISFKVKLLFTLLIAFGSWLWIERDHLQNWSSDFLSYVDNRDLLVLDAKYTPEQIIKANYSDLAGLKNGDWQEPILKYYPYLLLDIKYQENQQSREGVLLWGMVSGEMVIDTTTWENSHGFRDCLECKAGHSDFKIIQALAKNNGVMSLESLQKELQVERSSLDLWLENAKKKHLITQNGAKVQLHFENPRLLVQPQTQINHQLVSKPSTTIIKEPRQFSRNQILTMVKAAFGEDLKVRSEQEVYLPVYSLKIVNADKSVYNAEWNAVTGQRIYPYYLSMK